MTVNDGLPRLRMFAGPNGSGKTTVKDALNKSPNWFGICINPNELELAIRTSGGLSLAEFPHFPAAEEVHRHFATSPLIRRCCDPVALDDIVLRDGRLEFRIPVFNSYHASVLSDFLRRRAMDSCRSFTTETVMSAFDKVELLRDARSRGYRTYLYYIATEDPQINIQRVRNRVRQGGHDVPDDKIVARHRRSLELLPFALEHASRAYFFDTSGSEPWYFAEATAGKEIALKSDTMPRWFEPIWDRFEGAGPTNADQAEREP